MRVAGDAVQVRHYVRQRGAEIPTVCVRCHTAMWLDEETYRDSLRYMDDGPVYLYVCRHGHARRIDPPALPRPLPPPQPREMKRRDCGVCGRPMVGPFLGSRKYHGGNCATFAARERERAIRKGEEWCAERQPWFKGPMMRPARPPAMQPTMREL